MLPTWLLLKSSSQAGMVCSLRLCDLAEDPLRFYIPC